MISSTSYVINYPSEIQLTFASRFSQFTMTPSTSIAEGALPPKPPSPQTKTKFVKRELICTAICLCGFLAAGAVVIFATRYVSILTVRHSSGETLYDVYLL